MYEVDKLANLVPMANTHEQVALVEDIRRNGQQEPAVLWRGKIVDGRCRQLACITLGIKLVTRSLDSKLDKEEVVKIVKSLNTRRNLTDMQKAMSAYKSQETEWTTNEDIAKQWGIPLGTYKNARYVAVNRPDLVNALFDGYSVKIEDPDKGYEVTTNKINTLARIIKKMKEKKTVIVDDSERITFTVTGNLKTEAAKDWYYTQMKRLKDPSVDIEITIGMLLVELANLKFKEIT